jgi:hypothetical protein
MRVLSSRFIAYQHASLADLRKGFELSGSLSGDFTPSFHLKTFAEAPILNQVDQVLHYPHFMLVDSLNEVFFRHEDHRVQDLAIGDRCQYPKEQIEYTTWHGRFQCF